MDGSAVRQLFPPPRDATVDLDELYSVPDTGRQHVRGVMVSSVDGAAQAHGRSAGLSGAVDAHLFALLRSHADVLLVGRTTAVVEGYAGDRPSDERRRWRLTHSLAVAPRIAVVTGSCDLDPASGLFTQTVARPIVVTHRQAPSDRVEALRKVADVITVGDRVVDLGAALDALADRGLRSVSCEGGPTLLANLAAAGRLDELCLTVSPLLLAGPALRIADGAALDPATSLRLALVLEADHFLFLRYLRGDSRSRMDA